MSRSTFFFFFFFFNDTATTEIYTLSLHDALPISLPRAGAGRSREAPGSEDGRRAGGGGAAGGRDPRQAAGGDGADRDRKSTRLNSSHLVNSYALFCLKKKKK